MQETGAIRAWVHYSICMVLRSRTVAVVWLLAGVFAPAAWSEPGELLIRTDPPGLGLRVGGVLLGNAPQRVRLEPGMYRLELTRDGRLVGHFSVEALAGQFVYVDIRADAVVLEEGVAVAAAPTALTEQAAMVERRLALATQPAAEAVVLWFAGARLEELTLANPAAALLRRNSPVPPRRVQADLARAQEQFALPGVLVPLASAAEAAVVERQYGALLSNPSDLPAARLEAAGLLLRGAQAAGAGSGLRRLMLQRCLEQLWLLRTGRADQQAVARSISSRLVDLLRAELESEDLRVSLPGAVLAVQLSLYQQREAEELLPLLRQEEVRLNGRLGVSQRKLDRAKADLAAGISRYGAAPQRVADQRRIERLRADVAQAEGEVSAIRAQLELAAARSAGLQAESATNLVKQAEGSLGLARLLLACGYIEEAGDLVEMQVSRLGRSGPESIRPLVEQMAALRGRIRAAEARRTELLGGVGG